MASVAYPFTTNALILDLIGQLGLDLRVDDTTDDGAALLIWAINKATNTVGFFLQNRYSLALAAQVGWVQDAATWDAVRALCQHRLNDVPESINAEWEEYKTLLQMVLDRTATVPGLANIRRPIAVTNYTVDQRKYNNTIRVVPSKTTGVRQGYVEPTDTTGTDDR